MGSKREEERNEKVIRGLMKLPPNRRCINCNNLGPQYVCTNFWTFVCITCSGIHREFTHRVKSVSMAKFTSQEVEALQKGGNQRARETYLVHWDPQRQKQPNSSSAEKVREFIKHVYVDKKYAGKTLDKPPTGTQNLRHPEEETRRASSYHSYSQSPPYDYQYEERRYGRQLPVLTRKPGSDRGLYEGKVSNFSSPSRFSDQTLEHPRASDYSVSSPGQSPNFQRDGRVKSPPYQTTDNFSKENSERVRRPQRGTSSGSFGSFDSNSLSFKSNNSVTLADLVAAPDQSSETIQDIQYKQPVEVIQDEQYVNSSLPPSSTSTNFGGLDLFDTPFAPHNVTPSPTIDLLHLPEAQPKAPIDLFEPSSTSSVPNIHAQKPPETTPSSLNFFSQMPPVTMGKILPNEVVPKNEGWAMFDFPQQVTPNPNVVHNAHEPLPIHDLAHEPTSIHNLWNGEPYKAQVSFTSTRINEVVNTHEPTSMHNLWHEESYKSQVSSTNNQQPWDAFEDPNRQFPFSVTHQSGQEVAGQAPFTTVDQHLGTPFLQDFNQTGFDRVVLGRPPITNIPFHVEAHTHVIERKSSNPFDLSDDCDFESGSMYLNMNSLQTALPSGQLPNSFVDDVNQPWFAHNPASHYVPTAQQAALGYMGGPAPSVQMTNVPNQEPVAPVGGNPFA